MTDKYNILAVITARGGSKGIPKKNIKKLAGKSLIVYSIEVAQKSRLITDLIVSTDSQEIAAVAERYGCSAPFLRPKELAEDTTPHLPVLQHALRFMEDKTGKKFDIVCLLQPTSPFRTVEDIDNTINILIDSKADSAVSIVETDNKVHPMKMKKIEQKNGFNFILPYCLAEPEGARRQDLPLCYQRSSAVYCQTRELLLKKNRLYGDRIVGYITSKKRYIDIDDEFDWQKAELMAQKLKELDFLVIGLQKSGTYWLTALLDNHPQVNCFPAMYGGQTGVEEGHIFDTLGSIDEDGGAKFQRVFSQAHKGYFSDLVLLLDKLNRKELYDVFRERYNSFCALRRKKKIVGEKTTEYIFHLDIIDYFYPGIKKICLLRDPRDRVVSFHFHQLRKNQKKEQFITDEYVKKYFVERVRPEYEILLKRKDVYCLTYEGLTFNFETTIDKLLDYLGVEKSKAIIEKMKKEAAFEAVTEKDKFLPKDKGRKRGRELRASHYRKGKVGDWQNHLSEKQAVIAGNVLGGLPKKVFVKYNLPIYGK